MRPGGWPRHLVSELGSHLFFMDKAEVLHRLKTSSQLQAMDDTLEWREAFKLYNETTGAKFRVKDMCRKCFTKVSAWLQDIKE